MATPVQNASLTALEDEVSLKEDVIRAQSLELESLRRELRAGKWCGPHTMYG